MKPSSLPKEEAYLKKLRLEILTEQEKLNQLKNQSQNLAARNRSVLESIEQEGVVKKRFLVGELGKEKSRLETVNGDLEESNDVLKAALYGLQDSNIKLNEDNKTLEERNRALNQQLIAANDALIGLDEEKIQKQEDLKDLRIDIGQLRGELSDVEDSKVQAKQELALLEEEMDKVQARISELDDTYKASKAEADKNIALVHTRLQKAIDMLRETQGKDEAMRKSWAVGLQQLEKREEVVRKRELKLADMESRVSEYERYMQL